MKTRDSEPVITTYVDVDNSSGELILMEGFPWGAGSNVCFRCGDGVSVPAGNGFITLSELRLVSLPSSMTYEIVRGTDEEYELPRDTGLEIAAVFVDGFESEFLTLNVTNVVSIEKINGSVGNSGISASLTFRDITKSVVIPISTIEVDLTEVSRSFADFYCSYNTTEFTAEERIESFSSSSGIEDGDYYFYDVKIYKEDLNPIVTYHVQHSNGIEADVSLNVFDVESSSLGSGGPYIEEFENGNDFIVSTLRDHRLNDAEFGFGVLPASGKSILTGPWFNGDQNDFIGDVLADRYLSPTGWGTTRFGTRSGSNLRGYGNDIQLDFDIIQSQGNEWLRETEDSHSVYLRLDWRRHEFCNVTLVDEGVLDSQYSRMETTCVSNNPSSSPRLKIWMPFKYKSFNSDSNTNIGYLVNINLLDPPVRILSNCENMPWLYSRHYVDFFTFDVPLFSQSAEYHITPFLSSNLFVNSGLNSSEVLTDNASIMLNYFNSYFNFDFGVNLNYIRNQDSYCGYTCDHVKYDILSKFEIINGENLWKSLQYASNYFDAQAHPTWLTKENKVKVELDHIEHGQFHVLGRGVTKVNLNFEISYFGKICIPIFFNKPFYLGTYPNVEGMLCEYITSVGVDSVMHEYYPSKETSRVEAQIGFEVSLKRYYFDSNGDFVKGDSYITTGAEEVYQVCEG